MTARSGTAWAFVGLRDAGQIAPVRVHPSNPDLVYVAALGNPFVPTPMRRVPAILLVMYGKTAC